MSTTLRVMRHYNADSTNGYDDYACIAFPYRPTDSLPYIPRRPFNGGQCSLKSIRLVDPRVYYKTSSSTCYVPFDAVISFAGGGQDCHLAFGDGLWPAFEADEDVARRLANATVSDLFNLFLSPTAAYYAARHYGIPQSLSGAFDYMAIVECREVTDDTPLRTERIAPHA